jgi:hypothetical protein
VITMAGLAGGHKLGRRRGLRRCPYGAVAAVRVNSRAEVNWRKERVNGHGAGVSCASRFWFEQPARGSWFGRRRVLLHERADHRTPT